MILKIKRKLMKLIWREAFYVYLWSNEWLETHKPHVVTTIDSRDYRETDTYTDRTSR